MQPLTPPAVDINPRTDRASLAGQLAAEIATAGGKTCGHTCECHSAIPCVRPPHPDDPDNRVPHLAYDADGVLYQWVGPCPPLLDTGQAWTPQHADQALADHKTAYTDALLANVDTARLKTALGL